MTVRRVIIVVSLVGVWCGLWGNVSVANVVAGAAVAWLVTSPRVAAPYRGAISVSALVRFLWLVLVDLVRSTISVAREVLTPTDWTDESIVAVPVPAAASQHLLMLTVAITLTPGTAVVEADPEAHVLYLHLLHHENADDTIAHVQALAQLAVEALPRHAQGAGS